MKKKVVIIGAGFAGLSALLGLLKKKELFDIKLIDKEDYFEYTPSLHLCLDNPEYVNNIRLSLKKYYREFFVKDNIKEIKKTKVIGKNKSYDYDYLVIASGSTTNFYNNNEFEKYALPLKRIKDVNKINSKLKKHQKIVVIGGGYTGVEITSILAEKQKYDISLVNLGKYLLNNPTISKRIEKFLENHSVKIKKEKEVISCNNDSITLNTGETIKTDLIIMSAGIKLNELIKDELCGDLCLENNKNIYLCGDVARSDKLSTAYNAMIEGRDVAKNIISRVTQNKSVKQKNRNWNLLAIALGERKGLITIGEKIIYVPFTGFLKWTIEKRVLFEFKHRIRLPI